jgi:NTE family protein
MDGSVVIGPLTRPHGTPTPGVEIKSINLALQGGGAHGAFTWGVLDRLLEDDRIRIEGISATSAGAINGAVLASGMAEGGHPGAKKGLPGFGTGSAKRHCRVRCSRHCWSACSVVTRWRNRRASSSSI